MINTTRLEFRCPKCGSSHFGSARKGDDVMLERFCHGASGCRFMWDESDDWSHFRLVKVSVPETREEYQDLQKAVLMESGIAQSSE